MSLGLFSSGQQGQAQSTGLLAGIGAPAGQTTGGSLFGSLSNPQLRPQTGFTSPQQQLAGNPARPLIPIGNPQGSLFPSPMNPSPQYNLFGQPAGLVPQMGQPYGNFQAYINQDSFEVYMQYLKNNKSRDFPYFAVPRGSTSNSFIVRHLSDNRIQEGIKNIQTKFDDNRKHIENIEKLVNGEKDKNTGLNVVRSELRDQILTFTKDSLRLRIWLKKVKFSIRELSEDCELIKLATSNFWEFENSIYKYPPMHSIAVPSNLLVKITQRLVKKIQNLSQKIFELEELLIEYNKNKSNQASVLQSNENGDNFNFFLNLLEQFYQYFNHVAKIVLNFNDIFMSFKAKVFSKYRQFGTTMLENEMNNICSSDLRDSIMEALETIARKIEGNKNLDSNKKIEVAHFQGTFGTPGSHLYNSSSHSLLK